MQDEAEILRHLPFVCSQAYTRSCEARRDAFQRLPVRHRDFTGSLRGHAIGQQAWTHAEGEGQCAQRPQRDILCSAFDVREIWLRNAGPPGELHLGQSARQAPEQQIVVKRELVHL
ncbi:MAG: hypothetical protein A3B78_01485 [Omnitrophica WOR_2 bacterium RIFCSPHIGHO2_02_FULL_67_20]|nr:MAG: hypothetical protein A3B78_01485 [Omnitrophica WOR_2 bacterium RIFCSPHIGHO2_02_FULL_67_20]